MVNLLHGSGTPIGETSPEAQTSENTHVSPSIKDDSDLLREPPSPCPLTQECTRLHSLILANYPVHQRHGNTQSRHRNPTPPLPFPYICRHTVTERSMTTTTSGFVAPGFEPVADAFARNFSEHGDVGASFAVNLRGEPVVDLYGGVADSPPPTDPGQATRSRSSSPAPRDWSRPA